jgi:molybdopterin-guanine dinucleotide biosynthesis protein A
VEICHIEGDGGNQHGAPNSVQEAPRSGVMRKSGAALEKKRKLAGVLSEKAFANAPMYHRPMCASPALTAFILAGGRSTRMGIDKAFVTLNGQTLLIRALDVARSITPNVRIVGDPAKFSPFAPTVADIFTNCGPLAGIHAALRSSPTELNLILAVDVPFVSTALLHYLIQCADTNVALVTVVQTGGGYQPLCAIYRRAFAEIAEQSLQAGRYKIDTLFAATTTQTITEKELETAGFSSNLFRNLNTPKELSEASERTTSD